MDATAVAATNADGYAGSAAHVCNATTPLANSARNGMTGERIVNPHACGSAAALPPEGAHSRFGSGPSALGMGSHACVCQQLYGLAIDMAIRRSADCDGLGMG